MNDHLFRAIQIEKPKVMRHQIRDAVRELLGSGQFAPGDRLPSNRSLAVMWHTDTRTVHAALSQLAKEGLLELCHGKGTFVRQRDAKLTCVGVYYSQDFFANHASDFLRAVHAALQEQLDRRGIQLRVWIDHRPAGEHGTPWPELARAAADRQIQSVIGMSGGWPAVRRLNKLPVPSVFLGSANLPNVVGSDLPQLAELSLRRLAAQGCRSVGLITAMPVNVTNPDGSRHAYVEFFERFNDVARDLGLGVHNEWMRLPSLTAVLRGCPGAPYGYREFMKLWNLLRRPAGLVVTDDVVARGVILGLQARQVRVPEELKLVLVKNEAIPLVCPVPVTFAVSSEREIARALLTQIDKQFRGESCQPIRVPFRLVAHRGDRQQ